MQKKSNLINVEKTSNYIFKSGKLSLRVRRFSVPRVIHAANIFGCSHVIAHSHARQFQQAGISTDAQDQRDVRKHRQDKTRCIDVSGSSQQL